MTSNRAWYWLAAGVLALGLNGAYQDGEFSWAHCLVDRSMSSLQRGAERGHELLAMAEIMLGRTPEAAERAEAAVDRSEAVLDRTQARLEALKTKVVCERIANAHRKMAMEQVERALSSADVQRKLARAQAKMNQVRVVGLEREASRNCPGISRVVMMRPIPRIDLPNLPDIRIPDLGEIQHGSDSNAGGPI
jgi:hypothetical protein